MLNKSSMNNRLLLDYRLVDPSLTFAVVLSTWHDNHAQRLKGPHLTRQFLDILGMSARIQMFWEFPDCFPWCLMPFALPIRDIRIHFDAKTSAFCPPDLISGHVDVISQKTCVCRAVEIELVRWTVASEAYCRHPLRQRTVVERMVVPGSKWDAGQFFMFAFSFSKYKAVPTYHGKLFTIQWELAVRVVLNHFRVVEVGRLITIVPESTAPMSKLEKVEIPPMRKRVSILLGLTILPLVGAWLFAQSDNLLFNQFVGAVACGIGALATAILLARSIGSYFVAPTSMDFSSVIVPGHSAKAVLHLPAERKPPENLRLHLVGTERLRQRIGRLWLQRRKCVVYYATVRPTPIASRQQERTTVQAIAEFEISPFAPVAYEVGWATIDWRMTVVTQRGAYRWSTKLKLEGSIDRTLDETSDTDAKAKAIEEEVMEEVKPTGDTQDSDERSATTDGERS